MIDMTFNENVQALLNITLTEEQLKRFNDYYHELIEYNKITNLTTITDEEGVYFKHFFDSLTLARTIDMNKISTLCDMGSGAGFPSIPLKIVYPHLKITIVDSLNKRILFLKKLNEVLEIPDVSCIHDRIETFALKNLTSFDLVTARALGHLRLISEMGIPMVREGGIFVPLKGPHFQDEIDQSVNALKLLKASIEKIDVFELPNQLGKRANIIIRKHKHITGYPRAYHVMTKKPL